MEELEELWQEEESESVTIWCPGRHLGVCYLRRCILKLLSGEGVNEEKLSFLSGLSDFLLSVYPFIRLA